MSYPLRTLTPWATEANSSTGDRRVCLRAENMTLADIAATLGVSKSSVSSGSATSPSPRPNADTARSAARIPPTRPSSARSRSSTRSASSASAPWRSKPSSPRASRSTPAKARRPTERSCSRTPIARMVSFFCAWLRQFFAIDEVAAARTCLPPRRPRSRRRGAALVRGHRHPADAVPCAVPSSCGPDDSTERSTSSAACTSATAAARRIARSWA